MYIFFNRKNLLAVGAVIISLSLAAVCSIASYGKSSKNGSLRVIVDAGHGLPDGGAVGTGGSIEQEINLSIAKKLAEVLEAKGVDVIMTRTDENGIWTDESADIRKKKLEDMHERLKIMKKSDADLFLSIHMNSYKSSSASGLRIFYSAKFEAIKPLAENIQIRMSDISGAHTSVVETADNSLFLMKNPPQPAILVECGFLSNPAEEKRLGDDDYRSRLAWAIADAVEKYYVAP